MARSIQEQLDAIFKTSGIVASKVEEIVRSETDRMANILRDNARDAAGGRDFLDHIVVNDAVQTSTIGNAVEASMTIGYDEGAVHRESWYPEKYGEGADLFTLFNFGYKARDYVYNRETGQRSRISREPTNFIQNSVDQFNASSSYGARAELNI